MSAGRREDRVIVASTTDPIITLVDLELTLPSLAGPVEILRGLTTEVGRGETVSVVGPSGSGKSSMMMIVAGLQRQSAGLARICGHDLAGLDEDGLARFRRDSVGIVFQDFHLVPTMTALENVAIPLELAGRADAFERAAAALEAVGLDHRLSHYPAQLSGGEQQRTALARAVAPEPALLLADEPTGNLDGDTGAQVIDLLFELQAGHAATLMLITHDTRLAARCDRHLRMQDGRIQEEAGGTATAALTEARPGA